MKPHKVAQWLYPKCSPEELAEGSRRICEVYKEAATLQEQGIKTLSVDEKTGMQALERNAPDLPLQVGNPEKHEVEYTRHGTQCLIANWDVVEGKCVHSTISDTRTEKDFQEHIQQTIESYAEDTKFRFVVDNLNTHCSETLVKYVAGFENTTQEELGKKGKKGILKNKATRTLYLQNAAHKISFIYTPKHCSWLNQIEIFFGILHKKVIKRGNFTSKEDLKNKVEKFIAYFNETMAKPFKWTYGGKPCKF
ncbi:MAG: transposase [Bernardetiaceae bacterium]|nr:transposase [Bernardetiaceae bacterium]